MGKLVTALVGLFAGCGSAFGLAPFGVGCAPSAEAAVARLLHGDMGAGDVGGGFKVVSVRKDPLRKRRWAMLASCEDASRPMQAVELEDVAAEAAKPVAEVHLGDRVSVVQRGDDSSFRITGVAESSGVEHDVIRVQLPKFSAEEDAPAPVIRCRVVGPDVVEVLP